MSGIKYASFVIALVLLALLVIEFNSRTEELNRLLAEQEIVEAEYNERLQMKAYLESELAYAESDAAVYEYAYNHNMARPGDIPIVPIQAYVPTPTPEPAPEIIVVEKSNWQHWLSLLTDTKSLE